MDGMFETYIKTRRMVDGVSDDVLACIVPGALTDDPENPQSFRRREKPQEVGPETTKATDRPH